MRTSPTGQRIEHALIPDAWLPPLAQEQDVITGDPGGVDQESNEQPAHEWEKVEDRVVEQQPERRDTPVVM